MKYYMNIQTGTVQSEQDWIDDGINLDDLTGVIECDGYWVEV